MDVRLFARAAGACATRRRSSSTGSGPARGSTSTTGSGPRKLDAAVEASGWRELRQRRPRAARRSPRGSRWPSSPRSSAVAWPTSRSSARSWRPSCAGWPVRRRPRLAETVAPRTADLSSPAWRADGATAGGRGRRRRRATPRWCCSGAGPRRVRASAECRCGPATTRASISPAPCRRRSTPAVGRRRSTAAGRSTDDDLAALDGARAGPDLCRPGRGHARRHRAGLRRTPAPRRQFGVAIGSFQAVQHLLADALRGRWRARAASRCTPPGPSTRWPGRRGAGRGGGGQGVLRPGRPQRLRDVDPGARRASATPGSAWPTSTCGGPCFERPARRCRRQAWHGCWQHHRIGGGRWTSVTRPHEREFRLRLRAWLADNNPGLAGLVDRRRVLGRPGGLAPVAVRRRLLRHVVADGDRWPGAAERLRGHRGRRAGRRRRAAAARASATWCRASSITAATTSSGASFPAS